MATALTPDRVSGITETRERPLIGVTPFDWQRDYAASYSACPSAFWLAPDADAQLPEPDLLHPAAAPPPGEAGTPAPVGASNRRSGAALSIFLAGPIFLASLTAVDPGTMGSDLRTLPALMFLSLFAIPVGAVLAALPVAVGSITMGALGERAGGARHPLAWTLVGALMGAAITLPFAAGAIGIGAMTLTGAACAAIARWRVRWGPVPQPPRDLLPPARTVSA